MIAAVSALDVAFVGALAALVAPLSAWLIAHETHRHELQIDRERRLFEARRSLYEAALVDVFASVALTNAWEIKLRQRRTT